MPNIADIAAAAIQGGADGLCAINTMGPECYESHGHPVLTNGKGGVSGKDILPRALECVREIAAITDKPVIACGASAVPATCVTPSGWRFNCWHWLCADRHDNQPDSRLFQNLTCDLEGGSEQAEALVRYDVDMGFRPVTLVDNKRITDDICILRFDRKIDIEAGQFIFLWIPGLGEKPFSASPMTHFSWQ